MDNQNFIVYKKQLSSWNWFCGSGLGQHRQLGSFGAKVESTSQGGLQAFMVQKTPTDDHWMMQCKR